MKKIPVNIISGFLGSGKTTAIIKLLSQKSADEKWAVIINEFGKVSIDGQTLKSSSESGTVFDISGGCICCSAKGYFQENLETIIQTDNYQRIIIEPSGLGGIDMITDIIETKPELILMPSICLVDITAIENVRLQLNMIYRKQIADAGIVVFSKCDLLANIELQEQPVEKFKSFLPEKQHCLSVTQLTPSLLNMDFSHNISQKAAQLFFAGNSILTAENYQVKNYHLSIKTVFDSEKLTRFFNDHRAIVRAKGHIQTENGWKLVNFTLSGCIFEPCQAKEQNELVIISEKDDITLFQNLDEEFVKC